MKDSKTNASPAAGSSGSRAGRSPGRGSTVQKKYVRSVQRAGGPSAQSSEDVVSAAAQGVAGAGGTLPHAEAIQASFGEAHDVSGIKAHVGGAAAEASDAIGAQAYATGSDVAFKESPSLHTAAHEAAHVVQQRSGVSLKGGVGESGDQYEQHADAVADAVASGESAAPLLAPFSGGAGGKAVQRDDPPEGASAAPEEAENPFASLITAVDAGDFPAALAATAPPSGTCGEKPVRALAALQAAGKRAAFFTLLRGAKPYSDEQRATMYDIYHSIPFDLKKLLFEARFSVTLASIPDASGASADFTLAELNTLHDQANLLPGGHVEGLSTFTTLRRTLNATAEGSYGNPNVDMDAQADASRYAGVFRHEVGHAVEAALGSSADFKTGQAGWQRLADVPSFIAGVGGYGDLPAELQPRLDAAISAYLGAGNTFDAPTSTFEATLEAQVMAAHPDVTECLADGSDAVSQEMAQFKACYGSCPPLQAMIACEGSNNYWRYSNWHVANGKAWFVNHWYAAPYAVKASTHADLQGWPDQSAAQAAAFSDSEWFAETYSVWYSTPTPGTSHGWAGFVRAYFEGDVATLGAPGQAPEGGGGHPKVPR